MREPSVARQNLFSGSSVEADRTCKVLGRVFDFFSFIKRYGVEHGGRRCKTVSL